MHYLHFKMYYKNKSSPYLYIIWNFKTLACTVLDERTDAQPETNMPRSWDIITIIFFDSGKFLKVKQSSRMRPIQGERDYTVSSNVRIHVILFSLTFDFI